MLFRSTWIGRGSGFRGREDALGSWRVENPDNRRIVRHCLDHRRERSRFAGLADALARFKVPSFRALGRTFEIHRLI